MNVEQRQRPSTGGREKIYDVCEKSVLLFRGLSSARRGEKNLRKTDMLYFYLLCDEEFSIWRVIEGKSVEISRDN